MSLRLTSSALALMAFAMPALADVTPDEVWQTWLDYYKSTGYTVTEGSRDLAGETLTLKDVTFANATEASEKLEFTVPQITLQATGDGKVRTVYADTIPVVVSGTESDGETPFAAALTLSLPGNETVTSGSKEDMTHEMKLPTLAVTMDELTSGDDKADLAIKFVATNSTGTMHTVTGADAKYDSSMTSEKAEFSIASNDDVDGKLAMTASVAGLDFTANMMGVAAATEMQSNMAAALNKGFGMVGAMKAGKTDFSFDFSKPASQEFDTPAQTATGTGSVDAFDVAFNMAKEGLGYQVNSDKTQVQLTMSDLPFPVSYGLASSSFDLQFPVSKSETPAPFKMAYSINGLTLGDEIWDLFDPSKQLPRDPASLDIDVTGTLKVLKDLFDPAVLNAANDQEMEDEAIADGESDDMAQVAQDEAAPVEPVEITINQIALSAAGAKVSANGSLKPSADGNLETPVGTIHARYEGANALLDKLGKAGLIQEDQLPGIRMMLAMFARPAEGDDVLTTDLEFKDDGSVFANGQQVK